MASRNSFLAHVGACVALSLTLSCSGEREPPPKLDCAIDVDSDGYGPGCLNGEDCNDTDPTVHDNCEPCSVPSEGCPCPTNGDVVECIEHAAVYDDSVLCRAGERTCREGTWSSCEDMVSFEVSIDRERRLGASTRAIIGPDANIQCNPCSPQCRRITDKVDDPGMTPPDDPSLEYTDDGDGLTLHGEVVVPPVDVVDNTRCAVACALCTPTGPYDYDCDGNPDTVESGVCTAGDTACESVRPFTTTASGFTLQIGPGESGVFQLPITFNSRTVDVYFLVDTATVSSDVVTALKNSLTQGGPYFYDSSVDLTGCATANQGIVGSLQCLLNNAGFGLGFTRDVPFEGPVNTISYGWDNIDGISSDPSLPFSDFMYENLSGITSDIPTLASALPRLVLRADPDPNGPNGQLQGLYAVATGTEAFVGFDRPAVPDALCSGTTFGYPCFRTKDATNAATTPIVVLITGKPLYNGPTADHQGNAITLPGTYAASYPSALDAAKVHVGSYAGYVETRQTLATDFENFSTAHRIDLQTDPATLSGTPAQVGSVHDNLLTFTGDTTNMSADVDALFFDCSGAYDLTGSDVVHYFSLNPDVAGGQTYVHISTEGTRFKSMLGLVKADITTPPVLESTNLTEYCCIDTTYPDYQTACATAPRPAGCCLPASSCGDSSDVPYDIGEIQPGTKAVLTGNLIQGGNYPVDLLECFSHASVSQCGQTTKASDVAPDSVFKFTLSQDMSLKFWSDAGFDTDMALFVEQPNGVEDIRLGLNPEEDHPDGYNIGTINGRAIRFLGEGLCVGGPNDGQTCTEASDCPAGTCDSEAQTCNGFTLENADSTYDNKSVFNTATDMTASNSTYACSGADGQGPDLLFPFHVSKNGTKVALSTSGGQPQQELQRNTIVAVRQLTPPGAIGTTATGNYDDFQTAWPISEADFTPTTTNKYADVTSSISGATTTLGDINLLTNYYNAYRCTANDVSLCSLPASPGQSSCLNTGVNAVTDQWLASTADVLYTFTTVDTRDLKISAVGLDGAKHHLVLFDAATMNAVPPAAEGSGTSVTESAPTYTSLGNFSTLASSETSTSSSSFTLSSGSGSPTAASVPLASRTLTPSFGLATGETAAAAYDFGTLEGGDTIATNNLALVGVSDYNTGAISCKTAANPDKVYKFTASRSGSVSVTLNATSQTTSGNAASQKYAVMQIYSSETLNGGNTVSGATCGFGSGASGTLTRTFNVTAGTTYYIAVSSYGLWAGTYKVTVATAQLANGDVVSGTPSSNSALDLGSIGVGSAFVASGEGLTTSSTSIDSDYTLPCTGSVASADQVTYVTATGAGSLSVKAAAAAGSTLTPAVAVYADNGSGGLGTNLGCSTASGTAVVGQTVAGTKYYIVVAGTTATSKGKYTLTVSLDALASGNTTAEALSLGTLSSGEIRNVSGSGLTTDNAAIVPNYAPSCGAATSPDQVLSFVAGATAPVTVSITSSTWTSGLSPAIALYSESGGTLGTALGCASGSATPSFTSSSSLTAGQTYYVVVSGNATTAKGTYNLRVQVSSSLYDNVTTAGTISLAATGAATLSNTTGAVTGRNVSSDYDAVQVTCNAGTSAKDHVYRVTNVNSAGDLRFLLTPTAFAGAIAVYTDAGSALGTSLGCAASSTSGGTVELSVKPTSSSVYVIVSGNGNSDAGSYTLAVAPGVHDTVAGAHDFGTIDGTSASVTNTTSQPGVTQNYDNTSADGNSALDTVWCNKTGGSATTRRGFDQVYKFRVASASNTKVEVQLVPTGFRGVVQVRTASGTLATNNIGCSAGAADGSTATVSFTPTDNTEYYVYVSGWDNSELGTYTLTVRDAQNGNYGCSTSTAPERAVVTVKDLPAGTYYVLLKMDTSGVALTDELGVPYTQEQRDSVSLTVEDASWSAAFSTYFCELNNYQPFESAYRNGTTRLNRTELELTLDEGDYVAIVKEEKKRSGGGGTTSDSDRIKLIIRDKSHQPDVYGCHNTDLKGSYSTGVVDYFSFGPAADPPSDKLPACEPGYTAPCPGHYINYYLVMRAQNAGDVPTGAGADYTVHISDGDLANPVTSCSNGSVPTSYDGYLDNGNYFAVVKGETTDDKGWYQLTVGAPKTVPSNGDPDLVAWSSTDFTAERSYANVVSKLQNPGTGRPGMKVIGIVDNTDTVDATSVTATKKQLQKLAYDTATMAVNSSPLVTQIVSSGGDAKTTFNTADIPYGITRSIQELAQSLVMDVSVVLDPAPAYANPGFDISILATGTEPNCMGGSAANTWFDCHLTAMPNFEVQVENPEDAPVPYQMGGYDMMLDILGKVQIGNDASGPIYRTYVIYQIPLHVDASNTPVGMGNIVYDATGTYSQRFEATRCFATEAPDWSRLTFDGTVPGDSSLEFKVCTGDTSAEAQSCVGKSAVTVTSGSACTSDAQCPGGFCHNDQICWYLDGPACTKTADCGQGGTCTMGYCTWSDVPIDVGAALRAGQNGKNFARVDVVFNASSMRDQAPILNEWKIEYDCVSGE